MTQAIETDDGETLPGAGVATASLTPPVIRRPRRHWVTSRRLSAVVLALWFGVTFGVSWFARSLDFTLFGWPFPYYMGAQGAPVFCLLLILAYTWAMNRIDRRDGFDPESTP